MRKASLPSLLFALAMSCGDKPEVGGACDDAGYVCQDESTAFECRANRWVALPCKGPRGCREGAASIHCDWSSAVAGDACPSTHVGSGLCGPDGRTLLVCGAEGIVTSTCEACTVHGGEAGCVDDGVGGGVGVPDEGEVSVLVSKNGIPWPAINVVFHAPDGAPLAHLQTGSDGRAAAIVPRGAIATVAFLDDDGEGRGLWSWFDLEPGDELRLALPDSSSQQLGEAAITLPASLADAATYDLATCNGSFHNPPLDVPATMWLQRRCRGKSGGIGFLAFAYDATSKVTGYSSKRVGVPADGGTTAVTMPPWQRDFDDFGLQLLGAPTVKRIDTEVVLQEDGVPLRSLAYASQMPPPGGGITSVTRIPRGAGDAVVVRTYARWDDGESSIEKRVDKTALTQSIDLSKELLPRIRGVNVNLTQEARPAVNWAVEGPVQGADSALVVVRWDAANVWMLQLPPTVGGPVRVPALPGALSAWSPSGANYAPPSVVFVDDGSVVSWREARRRPVTLPDPFDGRLDEDDDIRRIAYGGAY